MFVKSIVGGEETVWPDLIRLAAGLRFMTSGYGSITELEKSSGGRWQLVRGKEVMK